MPAQAEVETATRSLVEVANAFREEAEAVSCSHQEAEILATAALINYLAAAKPELFSTPRKAPRPAIASSLS